MNILRFSSTRLTTTGKRGILTPNSDGYYAIPIGGLNALNSVGDMYLYKGAESLFEESSIFMRRVRNGNLKAEEGHPKRLPGMTDDDYLDRILTIEETNVCAHISEVWLDFDYGKRNPQFGLPDLIAIMGLVKPAGPHAASTAASFENPKENVNFSIRALTNDFIQAGRRYRVLCTINTFDKVTEQGIPNANKWDSPALEDMSSLRITQRQIARIANNADIAATENSRMVAMEAIRSMARVTTLPSLPIYSRGW